MTKSNAVFVGMDVHKESIDIAVAAGGMRGEVRHYGTIGGGMGDVDRALRKVVAQGGELHVVYEAGPCGYALYPVVQALQTLRGVQLVIAATLVAEIGDIGRFDHPRQLMAYLGLVPSEHSSGQSTHRGAITKCGNSHARRMLTEAAWNYRLPARITPIIAKRQDGQALGLSIARW